MLCGAALVNGTDGVMSTEACGAKSVTSRLRASQSAVVNGASAHDGVCNGVSKTEARQNVRDPNQDKLDAIETTTRYLLSLINHRPEMAVICGSGLGGLSELMQDVTVVPYERIPNFVATTVKGHAGKLLFGTLNGKHVVLMHGRFHYYEGHSMWEVTFPVRVFHALGVRILMVTNAAGGLNPDHSVGDFVVLSDHLNFPGLCGVNPLIGLGNERFGPMFPTLSDAYDRELRDVLHQTAVDIGLNGLRDGVYAFQTGPCYETAAECRMLRLLGADVVGMSTVPEVIVARHVVPPMRCVGISLITNMCSVEVKNGQDEHDSILETAARRSDDLRRLVSEFVSAIGNDVADVPTN